MRSQLQPDFNSLRELNRLHREELMRDAAIERLRRKIQPQRPAVESFIPIILAAASIVIAVISI
jgi:hypothetical protein